jgi:hypothetical protein
MDAATREAVRRRAENRCEYCLLQQEYSRLAHHVEHIVAQQHGGGDTLDNLALACNRCNRHKGPNLTGIDQASGHVVRLFDPRRDQWARHFAFRGARIEGITPTGRATTQVLSMNASRRLELRSRLLARGLLT